MAAAVEAFHGEHLRLYAHADESNPVEFVELRVRIIGDLPTPPAAAARASDGHVAQPFDYRRLRLNGASLPRVPVYRRTDLRPGAPVAGPAVIEQADTTILVPPAFHAEAGVVGELRIAKDI